MVNVSLDCCNFFAEKDLPRRLLQLFSASGTAVSARVAGSDVAVGVPVASVDGVGGSILKCQNQHRAS